MEIKRRIHKTPAMMEAVSLRMSVSDKEALARAAQAQGKPTSVFIRETLREVVAA